MSRLLLLVLVLSNEAACSKEAKSVAQDRTDPVAKSAKAPNAAPAPDTHHKDEPEEHEALPSRVRLPQAVVTRARIKTAATTMEALPQTVSLTGELIADPDRSAKVAVRVQGRIVEILFKEGDHVKKGDVLAIIESPELARARAASTSAVAKAASARKNLERLRSIAAKGLASGQEVSTAEAELASLDAEVRAARQTLSAFGPNAADAGEAARLQIRAPISGSVLGRDAVRGETVPAEHVIATIADLGKTFFLARLFEKDIARVKVGSLTEVRLNAYPSEVFEGSVEMVGNQLDPTARTVVARIAVPNRGELLKVGLFGSALVVVLDATPRTPRVVVPLGAVTKVADKDVVFVHEPDDDFEMHPVTLGRSAAGRVEVLSGLREGEQVVVDGVFTLKSAILKSTFGEED